MQKILFISFLLFGCLYANTTDDKVLEFEKKRLTNSNKKMSVEELKIIHKQKVDIPGWYGYMIDIKVKLNDNEARAKDIVFSNGVLVASDLLDINTGESLKGSIAPQLSQEFYNKAHLIAGSNKAKNKIVLFSDPLCPACKMVVPNLIKYVKNNPKNMGLYYYHFPLLQLHPAAQTLSKAMIVASKEGLKNIELKTYTEDFSKYFESKEQDEKVILDGFNKIFKTNISIKSIEKENIGEELLNDMVMGDSVMVNSTPTIYINGTKDKTQQKYKMLGN